MRRLLITTSAVVLLLSVLWGCFGSRDTSRTPAGYESVFGDTRYRRGFSVGAVRDGGALIQGYLDYDGAARHNPHWHIAQWYSYRNDILSARYMRQGSEHRYETEHGSKVVVDTAAGTVLLELDASHEYGFNGMDNPRKEGQNWPHLLMCYRFAEGDNLKVSDKREIHMDVDYTLTCFEDKMPAGTTDPVLHAAQFQWFVVVQNLNADSPDFGRFFWFGLSYFDTRHEFSPFYAAQDGGKAVNTGAFIYMPSMKDILGVQGKTEPGKPMHVHVDVLPMLRSGFDVARQRGYLSASRWEDFYISDMNIGWEVPGTYHVGVRIDYLNINYK